MVARLVLLWVSLAVARLFPDRHRAGGLRTSARCLRAVGATADRQWRAGGAAARYTPSAAAGRRATAAAVADRRSTRAHQLDAATRPADHRRDPAGGSAAGPEMAGGQRRADARAVYAP